MADWNPAQYLASLTSQEQADFLNDYKTSLKKVYPLQKNNKILFPFTRIFFTAQN